MAKDTKGTAVRRLELLHLVRQPGPMDSTPRNRRQRRQADRALRKVELHSDLRRKGKK